MMIPCQLLTFSEFIWNAFQFLGLIAEKISKCMKNNKWSQKGLEIDDVALNGAFWTQNNYGVPISSTKWNPFVTDEFPYEILILWKRLSVLYTKCIHFLPGPSQLSCTCYLDEMMIPCQLSTFSEFICSAFQFQGLIAEKISKFTKNNKWSQKG